MENEAVVAPENPVADLEVTLARVRAAQAKYATYTQEQVDAIFKAAALAANRIRIPLAKMAVAETGMGIVEDKIIKNHYAAEYIYNTYKETKTCGVVEEDESAGIMKVAEPIGVIGAVIPTTNPTSTAIFKTPPRSSRRSSRSRRATASSSAPTRAPRTARSRPRRPSSTRPSRRARPRTSSAGSRRRASRRRTSS